ncbi:MAG: hypothetical protein JW778_03880 [Candidatus Altiarchaeota archaeon]|nr:hypothetical protein [Candidatus Altiarchaeota archaeon]
MLDQLKYFLKPDKEKLVLFLIVGITLFSIEWWWIPPCCDFIYYQGLPLPIYYWGGFVGFPRTFIHTNFLIDLLAWYLISAVILLGAKKLKNII